jgi:hydroxyacylglutathione hydrolase
MIFQRIESEGLAHYSYLIGDGGQAVVIDPRRDCDVYQRLAHQAGCRVEHILETHRNEDYVIGSLELGERTGARLWHADSQLPYGYGSPVEDRQVWQFGDFELQALHTPGHTPGSMSYVLREVGTDVALMVFCGDMLFAGDVGRVDLLGPDRMVDLAGQLYDSLYERLLPLGDQTIVCPAHGAGSVCGSSIARRPWTTIGAERQLNPRLGYGSRNAFIAEVARELERPPYFRKMEELNVNGPPILGRAPTPAPLPAEEFASDAADTLVLDTRSELAFGAAHVPGALFIWAGGLASFGGWFMPYDRPLSLVVHDGDLDQVIRDLVRLGYDRIAGYLSGGLLAWHVAGKESQSVATITVQNLCQKLDRGAEAWILDVRSAEELETEGQIEGAQHIHITQLQGSLEHVPTDRPIHIFCGSGLRSMTAASILKRQGWDRVTVVLGGIAGWNSMTCPISL